MFSNQNECCIRTLGVVKAFRLILLNIAKTFHFKARFRVEYDNDPLDAKGKRKRAASTTLLEHDHILPPIGSNIFNPTCVLDRNEVDAYREERKRLKKLHKEREREHKKKYKCFDDSCKHRKHKKRRKHKKHHHKDEVEVEEQAMAVIEDQISPDESVSQTGENMLALKTEEVTEKLPVKEDTEEEAGSTVTESSGSVYVS